MAYDISTILGQYLTTAGSAFHGNVGGGTFAGRAIQSKDNINCFIRRGVIKHATPGFFGYVVELDDGTNISCIPPDGGSGVVHGIGSTSCTVLSPGMEVAVITAGIGMTTGTILCALTPQTAHKIDKSGGEFHIFKTDEGICAHSEKEKPYNGETVQKMITPSVGMYKTSDTYPGDWAIFNEFGAGYLLGRTRLMIRGSNMARVDMFPINDIIRIAVGYLQMFTHGGKTIIFSDNDGYTSYEKLFSPYVWETAGCKNRGDFDKKIKIPSGKDEGAELLENPDLARYREFIGSFAGGKQIFTSYPKDDVNVGLSHVALSDSGALVFRSTSDIIFTQTEKIDVPVRIREPEKHEDKETPKINEKNEQPGDGDWWDHHIGRRTAANIIKRLYKRFEDNPNDWRIDSKPAKSDYDRNTGSTADIRERGSSHIVLGKDGSIVLQTSKGAEIKLLKEDIIISCPGVIRFQAGKQIAAVSGGETYLKSKKDIEMSSRANFSISAKGRVATFAENSFFCDVGNANDKKDIGAFAKDTGLKTRGIYFRSTGNTKPFVVESQVINLRPGKSASITSRNEKDKIPKNSMFSVEVGRIAESAFISAYGAMDSSGSTVKSGVFLTSGGGCVFGKSGNVVGESSVSVASSSHAAMIVEASGGGSAYSGLTKGVESLITSARKFYESFVKIREVPHFSYRDKYDFINGDFGLEESPWVDVKKQGVKTWGKETEINGTLPWPGKGEHVRTFYKDYSKKMKNDDDFGNKEDQEKDQPEEKMIKFEKYKG